MFSPDEQHIRKEHSVDAILRLTREHPGDITLICLGPLTNIAKCVHRDPHIGKKLKQCVIMGGNYRGKGNTTTSAEFNFHCDPEAAHVVLENLDCPITMVCWELCEDNFLPWEWYERFKECDSEIVHFLTNLEKYVIDNHYFPRFQHGFPRVYELTDQFAVAVAMDTTVSRRFVDVYASVELHGQLTRGQMVVDWNKILEKSSNIHLVLEVDVDKTVEMIMKGCAAKY